jgi:hypothetical protein
MEILLLLLLIAIEAKIIATRCRKKNEQSPTSLFCSLPLHLECDEAADRRSCQFEIAEMGPPTWPGPPIKSLRASRQQEPQKCWLKLITCLARVFIFSFIPGEKWTLNLKFPEQ